MKTSLGINTGNHTTSAALFDSGKEVVLQKRKLCFRPCFAGEFYDSKER